MDDRETLTVIDPASVAAEEPVASPTVHGVVLAAGTSSRYGGSNKLLELIDGEPVVTHTVEAVRAAGLDGITVILGHDAERVGAAVSGLRVNLQTNDRYAEGQSTSVATGVAAARERGADAVLIALGDMPFVSVETIETLLSVYARNAGDAVAAACGGKRGNPVLFDERFFDALSSVEGDVGGRELLYSDPGAVAVETGDPGVLHDVDSPGDLAGHRDER